MDYDIEVSLDDKTHRLNAMIEISYTNNSTDVLEVIHFHLWPNAYSPGTALAEQLNSQGDYGLHFSEPAERGSISGLRWTIDGKEAKFTFPEGVEDHGFLTLNTPLEPGGTTIIRTPFQVKIPSSEFSRLGHVGESYQITQWYPKPAVYDQNGWHPMSYLNQGEFYSEFGGVKVQITLPSNYVVGATGRLQEKEEKEAMIALSKSKEIRNSNEFPPSSSEAKTLTYIQDSIHDFAWFADKRFNVLYDHIVLPQSKDSIEAWVLYTNAHKEAWSRSMEYVRDGIFHYSEKVGEYPYSQVTVVDGTLSAGGGMEYPMVTVINGTSNDRALEQVIVHEIGHNWFYGILASNERSHAWMDEGMNTYYENRYFEEKYRGKEEGMLEKLGIGSRSIHELGYLHSACRHVDQGLDISSEAYTQLNYGVVVYSKGGYVLEHLSSVLGLEGFDIAIQGYFEDWKFRHPGPKDFTSSIEFSTGEDLIWFNDHLVKGKRKLDYKFIRDKEGKEKGKSSWELKERDRTKVPVTVQALEEGEEVFSIVMKPGETIRLDQDKVDKVIIDPHRQTLDIDRHSNSVRTQGILKSWQVPEFKFLGSINSKSEPTLYLSPVLGYNGNDLLMYGVYLSNRGLLEKPLEYAFTPMYGTGNKEWVGMADVRRKFYPTEGPSFFELSFKANRFSTGLELTSLMGGNTESSIGYSVYTVLRPSISYNYTDPSLKKGAHGFSYTYSHVMEDWTLDDDVLVPLIYVSNASQGYHTLNYSHDRPVILGDVSVQAEAEWHESYLKFDLGYRRSHVINRKGKCFEWGVYAAKMFTRERAPFGAVLSLSGMGSSYRLDGTADDYRFDHLLFDRNGEGSFASQQLVDNRGGFVQSSPYGRSDDWVAALNLKLDLPIGLPLSLYANTGVYPSVLASAGETEPNSLWETGITLQVIRDIVDISFPLIISKEIQEFYDFAKLTYKETIRFQFRLEELSLRNLRKAADL